MINMPRPEPKTSGYYWVQISGSWIPAQLHVRFDDAKPMWYIIGRAGELDGDHISRIGDRIMPPEAGS